MEAATLRRLAFGLALALLAGPALTEETLEQRLWEAARQNDVALARELLEAGAQPDAAFRDGATALLYAAQRGHAEVVDLLLRHGADPDARAIMNQVTASHFAIRHPAVLRLLVRHGADVNVHDLQTGLTPVALATARDCLECLQIFLSSESLKAESVIEALDLAKRLRREEHQPLLSAALSALEFIPSWPQFRGENASGLAMGAQPPVRWDLETGTNLRWKTRIPGLGHSSPVVWGDRVFLTTAISSRSTTDFSRMASPLASADDTSPHEWRVIAIDRTSGEILWEQIAHEGSPRTKRSLKNSYATETPVTNGKHVVAFFGSHGLYCYDLDGRLLWKRDLGVIDSGFFYDPDYQWGTASSPILYQDLVIVQADAQEGSFIAAFDLDTGEQLWRTSRDELPSWSTPTLVEGRERIELVTNGINKIRGYDPSSGKLLWSMTTGNSMIAAATPVAGQELIVVGNGYRPLKPIYAIRTGAQGDISLRDGQTANPYVAWSTKNGGPYYTTPIIVDDHLYVLANNGVLTSYYIQTGEQIYRRRVGNGQSGFSASPVAADGKLFIASEDGEVYVVEAGLEYELISTNSVGEMVTATPAIVEDMIILRTRSHLLGIGEPLPAAAQAPEEPEGSP